MSLVFQDGSRTVSLPKPRQPAGGGFATYGGGFAAPPPGGMTPAQKAAPQASGGFQAYAPKTQQNFYNSPSGNLAYSQPGNRPPPFQQIVRDASGQQVDPGQMTNRRDAFIQAFNDWKAPHAQAFGMSGTPIPKTPVDQLWKQADEMVQGGWTNPFAAQPTMPQDQGTAYGQSLLGPPTPQPGSSQTMMPVLRAHNDPMNPTGPNYQQPARRPPPVIWNPTTRTYSINPAINPSDYNWGVPSAPPRPQGPVMYSGARRTPLGY